MKKIIIIFIICQSLNAYSESKIFHEKNQDGTRNFDIEFIFQSKNNVRQNFDLLTDFLKIHRFNPSVYETEIISRESKEKTVLKTTFRNCVHFFCREMIMYESILTYCIDDQILSCVIKAEVMPNDESPVFSGNTLWKISASQSNGSKVYYKSEFTADIFLPPFFGESIFKKTINRNLDFLENSLNNFYF